MAIVLETLKLYDTPLVPMGHGQNVSRMETELFSNDFPEEITLYIFFLKSMFNKTISVIRNTWLASHVFFQDGADVWYPSCNTSNISGYEVHSS